MRNQGKISPIASLVQDSHDRNETDHSWEMVRIQHPDDNQQGSRHETTDVNPHLLEPEAASEAVVKQIADNPSQRAGHEIEKAKDCGVVACLGLSEVREVLQVIRAQDRVDRQFAAERRCVSRHVEEAVQAETYGQCLFDSRLNNNFALSCVEGLGAGDVGLVVESVDVSIRVILMFLVDGAPRGFLFVRGSGGTRRQRSGDAAGDVDNDIADGHAVGLEILLHALMAVLPLAHRRVLAEEQEAQPTEDQGDQRHNKRDPPRLAGVVVEVMK